MCYWCQCGFVILWVVVDVFGGCCDEFCYKGIGDCIDYYEMFGGDVGLFVVVEL